MKPTRSPRRPRHPATAGLLWAAVLLLVLTPALGKKKKQYVPYMVTPVVGSEKDPIGIEKVSVHREGLTAEVSYVTGIARRRMMQATLGIEHDPFVTPPGREPFFHTFLISLENTSSREMRFNPSTAHIKTDSNKVAFAIDYTALYQGIGQRSGLSMDDLHKITYDRNISLAPGGKARKLLVFERWVGKWESFVLGITVETDGVAPLDVTVPFEKQLLGEKKK
jgi:hypothetical protein